jgi:hypothetical protein
MKNAKMVKMNLISILKMHPASKNVSLERAQSMDPYALG